MAIISKLRETNHNKIISNIELTYTMDSLCNERKGKSKLLSVLKKSAGITSSISLSEIDYLAVDGFGMLHLLQKIEQIKTGTDIVNAVYLWVDNKIINLFNSHHGF